MTQWGALPGMRFGVNFFRLCWSFAQLLNYFCQSAARVSLLRHGLALNIFKDGKTKLNSYHNSVFSLKSLPSSQGNNFGRRSAEKRKDAGRRLKGDLRSGGHHKC